MTQREVAVIDNDLGMLKALNRLLTAHGFAVRVFNSAEAFLDSTASATTSCLVLDIHLDGMSGFELRRELAKAGSALPVIFMTAYDSPVTKQQALAVGCAAYFLKPFVASVLIKAIEEAGA